MNHLLAEMNGPLLMLGILATMGAIALLLVFAWRAARRGAMDKFRNLLSPEVRETFDSLLSRAPTEQAEAFRTWLVDSGDEGRALVAEKLNGGEQVASDRLVSWARAIVDQRKREQKDALPPASQPATGRPREEKSSRPAAAQPAGAEDWFTGQVAQLITLVGDDGGIANTTKICALGQALIDRGGAPLLRRAYYAVRGQGKDFRVEIWDSFGLRWRT